MTLPAAAAGTLTLGSDLTVNRLGFGAMRITGAGVWGDPSDPATARGVLREAVELGVDFIDTAHAYGPETSERLIAEALHPYPEGLVVATKGGLRRGGARDWYAAGRPETLRADCERSLELLRVERIDLYQLHRIDPAVPLEESVGALRDLRDEGKIHHVGLSNVDTAELERAQAIVPIVSVQNRYSLSERSGEAVLERCESEGLAFIPWYPLAAGELGGGALTEVAARRDASTFQVALGWLLQRSPALLPIPGTSSPAHLRENVAAAALRLSPEELAALG